METFFSSAFGAFFLLRGSVATGCKDGRGSATLQRTACHRQKGQDFAKDWKTDWLAHF